MTKRAFGYVRVSTGKQEISPGAQREAINVYVAQRGYELVEIFEDIGVSGAADIDARPGFLAALGHLEPDTVLVVSTLDRFGRDVVLTTVMAQLIEDRGAVLEATDGVGNGTGPEAELMRTIKAAFAQYERAMLIARTKTAMARLKAQGKRVGGVPYGYTVGPDNQLVPEASEQKVLGKIRQLHNAGFSPSAIADRFNEDGVPARGSKWHRNTVRRQILAMEKAAA